jgi:Zn-dependent peptidase ImmA (M78 family)/transcriptional regulator with XRE-family HTH domain
MLRKAIKGNMVLLARNSRGLSQKDLAKLLDVQQGTISKIELSESYEVTEEFLKKLETHLHYKAKIFSEAADIYPPLAGFHFRKKVSTKTKDLDVIIALANFHRIFVRKLFADARIDARLPFIQPDEFGNDAAEIARGVRRAWNIPKGRIENVVQLIEDAGVIIINANFESSPIDAFSVVDGINPPLIFLNNKIPGDRLRFTLAHELAHIIMHQRRVCLEMEKEANQFAAEFLMPERDIEPQLYDLSLSKLASLKEYWKVAMAALMKRGSDLNTISPNQYRYLCIQMNKHHFKIKEPIDIPREEPTTLRDAINGHFKELGFTPAELADALGLFDDELISRFPDNYLWKVASKPKLFIA